MPDNKPLLIQKGTHLKLLLFDIDGTLLMSGGAGKRAMSKAFVILYGHDSVMESISMSGRTDDLILKEAYEKSSVPFTKDELRRYKKIYFEILKKEILKPHTDKRLMPGIHRLLPLLNERNNISLGLLTGNWQQSGYIKIGHFGLQDYFPFGAFSDDSPIRHKLIPIAIKRFKEYSKMTITPDNIFVIGDTPADIQCTKPYGVKSIAVGAAHHSIDELKQHDPDYIFKDLEECDQFLELLT